jgi:AcrR family transcriptional regulator
MPRPRFARLAPDRQRQILERAAEEFGAHGYTHASLNRVIERLGLNKGAFYYCFDGKADLFGAVVQMVWDRFVPNGFDIAALDAASFWPSIRRLLRENHARIREEPWLAGIARLLANPPQSAAADAAISDVLTRGRAWARSLVQRGQEVGAVRTDVELDLLLDALMAVDQAADRWLLAAWDRLTPTEREAASVLVFDLWRRIADPAPAR